MNEERQKRIDELIEEINERLDQYNQYENVLGWVWFIGWFATGVVLIFAIRAFWAIALIAISLFVPAYLESKKPKAKTKEELCKEVCNLIVACIDVVDADRGTDSFKRPGTSGRVFIMPSTTILYYKFIKEFPFMSSSKLKSLLSVK